MAEVKIGLIGGSGLGQAIASRAQSQDAKRHEVETPFGRPSDAVVEADLGGQTVLFLSRHGPGHLLNPSQVPFRANIFALKQLGCTHVIATGAVGSLRDELRPRDLVVADQIIDKTHARAGTFYDRAAVHVEFAEPFCPALRRLLLEAAKTPEGEAAPEHRVHDRGCYVCMEGPAFSTRAESLMHRLWGGDLIGMTAMPEAKLAREAEMAYALIALVTDYDCWRRPPAATVVDAAPSVPGVQPPAAELLLKEILGNLGAATENAIALITRALQRLPSRLDDLSRSPALDALALAIWSDKSRVPADEVERLKPLWGRRFEPNARA